MPIIQNSINNPNWLLKINTMMHRSWCWLVVMLILHQYHLIPSPDINGFKRLKGSVSDFIPIHFL